MQILSQLSMTVLIHAAAVETFATILLCYGLAVGLGHAPAWLPMISDCAVRSPERYPFRLGIVIGAGLMASQVVMTYNADRPYSKNKSALVFGLIASLNMAIVGVVNEKECDPVHSGAAVLFFFCYEIYMIILNWFTPQVERGGGQIFRELCAIVVGIGLVVFAYMSTSWDKYSLYIAICEWSATIFILLFNWSFAADKSLSSLAVAELRENTLIAKV